MKNEYMITRLLQSDKLSIEERIWLQNIPIENTLVDYEKNKEKITIMYDKYFKYGVEE